MPDFDLEAAMQQRPDPEPGYAYSWSLNLRVEANLCPARMLTLICQRMSGAEAAVEELAGAAGEVRGTIGAVGWDRNEDDGMAALTFAVEVRSEGTQFTAVEAADLAETLWRQEAQRRLTLIQRVDLDDPRAEAWSVVPEGA